MTSKLENRFWGVLAALASLVPFYFFELDPANYALRYPLFPTGGDGYFIRLMIRSLLDGDSIPFLRMYFMRMGAPFDPISFSAVFPLPEQLQLLVLKIFTLFTRDPGQVLNLYYLSGYVLSSIAFYGSARWLRIRPVIAFSLSLAFTYLTYHFTRYDHLFLSQYWLLAPATALLVKVARKEIGHSRRENLLIFGASLFITAWHSYYGYFFCGLYVITWLYARRRFSKKALIHLAMPILGFLLAIGASTLHSVVARSHAVDPPPVFKRFPRDTRYYRLRVSSLVLPVPHHRILIFAEIRDRYMVSRGQIEGSSESLGTVGLVGLLLGIGGWIRRRWRKETSEEDDAYGFLQILAIFFASSFGFAVMVSYTITPVFRGVNRISPMVAALSLFVVGTLLTRFIARWDRSRFGKVYAACVSLALAGFVIWDQVPAVEFNAGAAREQDAAEKFVSEIDAKIGNAAVLQLPQVSFPEAPTVYRMLDYSHSTGPYFSKQARFSYGLSRGTKRYAEVQALAEHPTDLEAVRKHGYSGIWIDRNGYVDHGAALEQELAKVIPVKPIVSEDGRRSFFTLSP